MSTDLLLETGEIGAMPYPNIFEREGSDGIIGRLNALTLGSWLFSVKVSVLRATFLSLCLALAFGCTTHTASNLAQIEADAAKSAQPSPTSTPELLTSESVLNAFKAANLPVDNVVVYNEETDTNKLLGRPNQYVGKINFGDARVKPRGGEKRPNSIEVFAKDEDLQTRKQYTENISKSASIFAQYIYAHKNVLLRLTHDLLPKDAAQYENVLKAL